MYTMENCRKMDMRKGFVQIIGLGLLFVKESSLLRLCLVSLLFPVFRYQPQEWLLAVQAV